MLIVVSINEVDFAGGGRTNSSPTTCSAMNCPPLPGVEHKLHAPFPAMAATTPLVVVDLHRRRPLAHICMLAHMRWWGHRSVHWPTCSGMFSCVRQQSRMLRHSRGRQSGAANQSTRCWRLFSPHRRHHRRAESTILACDERRTRSATGSAWAQQLAYRRLGSRLSVGTVAGQC